MSESTTRIDNLIEPLDPNIEEGRRGFGSLVRLAGVPGAVILALVVVALIGPWIAPHDPLAVNPLDADLKPFEDPRYLLGTDSVGRDILSRLLVGTRLSLMIGVAPVVVASLIAISLAMVVALGPRWLGTAIMRVADVFLAFPHVMLALAVAAMLGPSLQNAMIALVAVLVPQILRVARGAALDISNRPFVSAAHMSGASKARVGIDVILPNMLPPVATYSVGLAGLMIVAAAGLSFLGVGVQPPTPEWGRMVADGRQTFLINPWPSLLPGIAIFIASMAVNLTADRLRTGSERGRL